MAMRWIASSPSRSAPTTPSSILLRSRAAAAAGERWFSPWGRHRRPHDAWTAFFRRRTDPVAPPWLSRRRRVRLLRQRCVQGVRPAPHRSRRPLVGPTPQAALSSIRCVAAPTSVCSFWVLPAGREPPRPAGHACPGPAHRRSLHRGPRRLDEGDWV